MRVSKRKVGVLVVLFLAVYLVFFSVLLSFRGEEKSRLEKIRLYGGSKLLEDSSAIVLGAARAPVESSVHALRMKSLWDSCMNDCNVYDNYILVYKTQQGLNDRISVLRHLGNIAFFLCAKLVVLPPSELLASKHEREGFQIGFDLEWSDILDTRFKNGETFVVDKLPNDGIDRLYIAGPSWEKREELFEQYIGLLKLGKPFIWDLSNVGYYKYRLTFLRSMKTKLLERQDFALPNIIRTSPLGCDATRLVTAPYSVRLVKLATELSAELHLTSSAVHLHIRRDDDGETMCDTSIERVQSFLTCSLQGCEEGAIVGLQTNVPPGQYRRKVQEIVEGLGLEFLSLEDKIESFVLRKIRAGQLSPSFQSNYILFALGNILQTQFFDKRLVLRRDISCEDCDKICVSS